MLSLIVVTNDIQKIDRVQNRFIGYANYLLKSHYQQYDYSSITKISSLNPLSDKRCKFDIKLIRGLNFLYSDI